MGYYAFVLPLGAVVDWEFTVRVGSPGSTSICMGYGVLQFQGRQHTTLSIIGGPGKGRRMKGTCSVPGTILALHTCYFTSTQYTAKSISLTSFYRQGDWGPEKVTCPVSPVSKRGSQNLNPDQPDLIPIGLGRILMVGSLFSLEKEVRTWQRVRDPWWDGGWFLEGWKTIRNNCGAECEKKRIKGLTN